MSTKVTPPTTIPAKKPKRAEIKAGKLNLEGTKCVSDPRRGVLSVVLGVEGRLRIQWSVRSGLGARVEDDMVANNTVVLEKIPGPPSSRIVRVKIRERPYLYWLQEPNESDDDELIKAFNAIIAEAPTHAVGTENLARDLDAILGRPRMPEPSAPPLQQASGAGGGARSGAAASGAAALSAVPQGAVGGGPGDLSSALQNALSSIGQVGVGGGAPQNRIVPTPLHTFATPQQMAELLEDESAVAELRDFMPPGQTSVEDIRAAIHSPQLSGAMRSLTQAVYSDQLPLLLSSLGLDASTLRSTNDRKQKIVISLEDEDVSWDALPAMEVLVLALEKQNPKKEGSSGGGQGGTPMDTTEGGGGDAPTSS